MIEGIVGPVKGVVETLYEGNNWSPKATIDEICITGGLLSRCCMICGNSFDSNGLNDNRQFCPECSNRLLKVLYPEVHENE